MLVVKVQLWPTGNKKRAIEIAEMRLWNNGSGDHRLGNYQANASYQGWGDALGGTRNGTVQMYPRLLRPVWTLVRQMLEAMDF